MEKPSKHIASEQRRINVDATLFNVGTTFKFFKCCDRDILIVIFFISRQKYEYSFEVSFWNSSNYQHNEFIHKNQEKISIILTVWLNMKLILLVLLPKQSTVHLSIRLTYIGL